MFSDIFIGGYRTAKIRFYYEIRKGGFFITLIGKSTLLIEFFVNLPTKIAMEI